MMGEVRVFLQIFFNGNSERISWITGLMVEIFEMAYFSSVLIFSLIYIRFACFLCYSFKGKLNEKV